jgi:hypothetical protein
MNTTSTGIIRTCMTIDCSDWELRVSSCTACCRPATSRLAV